MRLLVTFFGIFLATSLLAEVPPPVITVLNAYNGYGVVGGKLDIKPNEPIGISVINGNIKYNTITDAKGSWAVTFRYISTRVSVQSWSLDNPDSKSPSESQVIEIDDEKSSVLKNKCSKIHTKLKCEAAGCHWSTRPRRCTRLF